MVKRKTSLPEEESPKKSKRELSSKKVEDNSSYETKCITNSRLPLKPHQKMVVSYLFPSRGVGHRGAIAVHQVGSGKTLTAVTASQCFLDRNPDKKVIVITPTSLQANFKKEIDAYGGDQKDPRYEFYTFTGFLKAMEQRKVKCRDCFLIVDEAHNIRNSGGAISKIVMKASRMAQKVLLLTATPIVNGIYDLAVMHAIVNNKEPATEEEMEDLVEDPKSFKDFFKCIFSVYTTRSKATAKEYPDVVEKTVPLKMGKKFLSAYNKVQNSESKMFKGTNYETFYNGLRRAVNSIEKEYSPKIDYIIKKIKEGVEKMPCDKQDGRKPCYKAIVFSHFLDCGMGLVTKRLDKLNIPYAQVSGSMSMQNRQKAVMDYNNNSVKVLLISKAGGEGLDLKGTRDIFILEPAWNSTTVEQVIGRGVRYKSHAHLPEAQRKVRVFRLLMVKPSEMERFYYLKNMDFEKFRSLARDEDGEDKLIYSVDLYLYKMAKDKGESGAKLISKLKKIAIESKECQDSQ